MFKVSLVSVLSAVLHSQCCKSNDNITVNQGALQNYQPAQQRFLVVYSDITVFSHAA